MTSKTHEVIYKELLNSMKRDDTITDVSSRFQEWNTDFERVADCYSLLAFYNLLPEIDTPLNGKSAEVSERFKTDGNKAFVNKNDYLALYCYTRAVTYASNASKQLSLAYANRSAVTYSLGEFHDSVKDIERALSGDYPQHLKFKLLERKGKSLMKLGHYAGARGAFQAAVDCLPLSNLDCSKFKHTRCQLNSLLDECDKHPEATEVSPDFEYFIPELTAGRNPRIPSASTAINICYSPELGRHLVATQDINPGDVLAVENPYSSVSLPNSYFSHCFHCHKRCHSMIACTECTMVCYCDEACRQESWRDSHSVECGILKSLLQLNCGKMELLALRVLLNATEKGKNLSLLLSKLPELDDFDKPEKKGFVRDMYLSADYKAIHNLEGNTDLRGISYLFNRSVTSSCILHLLIDYTDFFENVSRGMSRDFKNTFRKLESKFRLSWDKILAGGLILKYLQSMASNAHEVSEMRSLPGLRGRDVFSSEIGSAAYPLLSLINHSCDPNVVRHSQAGSTVILTALQVIRKGEQILDNYGYHHAVHTKETRHAHLKSQYHFTCDCLACLEDWPLFLNTPSTNPLFLKQPNPEEISESSKKYKGILDKLSEGREGPLDSRDLKSWLPPVYSHLRLLQENIRRPWPEFNGCQEVIKQCLSFLTNHYFYKSHPQSLIDVSDKDTGVSPF